MRFLRVLVCLIAASQAYAAEWRNDIFGCAANLPDSAGWQPIAADNPPGMTILVAMQNPQKQSVFGINVLHNLPSANLQDPATIKAIDRLLQQLQYQSVGRSTVAIGGRSWTQYLVRGTGQPLTGVIRYTSANNQVYGVTILRGGGQEAAQDPELQAAAGSVQISEVQPAATAAAPVPAGSPAAPSTPAAPPVFPAVPATAGPQDPPATSAEETPFKIGPITLTPPQIRMILYAIGGLIILMILLKIIGGAGAPPKNR